MGNIITQALSALGGFFARSFWFGSFLPVVVFVAANVLIGRFALDWWATTLTTKVLGDNWVWGAPIAIALIVIAYAVAPLVPLCRAILDGRRLPRFLVDRLRNEPLARRRRLEEELEAANNYLERFNILVSGAAADFNAAEAVGEASASPPEPRRIVRAMTLLNRVAGSLANGAPSTEHFEQLVGAVIAALQTNKASQNLDLASLPLRTLGLLSSVTSQHTIIEQSRFTIARLEEQLKAMPTEMQPTAIGNARNLSEIYTQRVYNTSFAYLWPRVQLVIPDDQTIAKRIDAARALVDFAVLSLVLTVALLLIWLPTLALKDNTPWFFLLLGTVGALAVGFFYQLVVESQISLGELVQVAVDKYRFEVLRLLNIKAPATLLEERDIWRTLAAVARGDEPATDFVWTARP